MQLFCTFNICVELLVLKIGLVLSASIYFVVRFAIIATIPYYIIMNGVFALVISLSLIYFD